MLFSIKDADIHGPYNNNYTNGCKYIIIVKMHTCVLENVKKCDWATRIKSGFQVCTDGGDIGCDRRGEVGYMYSSCWCTMNKRGFFVHFCYASPHFYPRCALFYANYYYFSPNYKTKANSLRLVVRTHVRDFFYTS